MPTLLRIDASIRTEGSRSRALADLVEAEWLDGHPGGTVRRRDLVADAIPADAWHLAVTAGWTPEEQRSDEQRAAVALSAELVDELADADAILVAAPLYNFGPSLHVKTWMDTAIADPRLAPGAEPLLAGKPAVLATVRGGGYAEGTPRHGWDHSTPFLRRILGDVWGLDLAVVEEELTLAEVTPAMAGLLDLANAGRAAAEQVARDHGRELASALQSA